MNPPPIPPSGPPAATPPSAESRGARRFHVDVEARVTRASGQTLSARTRDVSRTGICVVSDQAVPRGEVLAVSLVLAFAEGTFSDPLRLAARCVWSTAIGKAFQVGAMFEDVSDEQDAFLETFLQFLDGTLAPRGGPPTEDDEPAPISPDDKDNPFK